MEKLKFKVDVGAGGNPSVGDNVIFHFFLSPFFILNNYPSITKEIDPKRNLFYYVWPDLITGIEKS